MQNETFNQSLKVLRFGFDSFKDMDISDWLRAPLLLLNSIFKFTIKNLKVIIIVIVFVVVFFYIIKVFRFLNRLMEEEGVETEMRTTSYYGVD